ncbi:hypothetical protein [Xanthomarina sp.]|uniref:hypothetical protein n=1 Tax=Xanthomarina sp. TaxID=1931211 RepID=UPI002CD4F3F0|nr:hypothetical protein [Xanthomarina sp.]HLV39984.1 hypothetical protein [Xanthomarina sp.]
MRSFITLIFIAFLSSFQVNAQSEVVNFNTHLETLITSMPSSNLDFAAKKRDILNTKINAKLKGEVDLFFVADKSKIC